MFNPTTPLRVKDAIKMFDLIDPEICKDLKANPAIMTTARIEDMMVKENELANTIAKVSPVSAIALCNEAQNVLLEAAAEYSKLIELLKSCHEPLQDTLTALMEVANKRLKDRFSGGGFGGGSF